MRSWSESEILVAALRNQLWNVLKNFFAHFSVLNWQHESREDKHQEKSNVGKRVSKVYTNIDFHSYL